MPRWYVSIDGKASGPFETTEVIESIKQRKYVLVDLVYQEGGSLWQSFDEVGEFKAAFEELRASDESRIKAGSHLNHPWVILKKVQETGPDKYLQEGPYSSEEVLNQIAKGTLQYSDYIWKKGFEKWIRIGFIPEFDRMRNLSENSFVDLKIPLPSDEDLLQPEMSDPDDETARISVDELLNSVRLLKKDETFYPKPEDDPDYLTPNLSRKPEPEVKTEIKSEIKPGHFEEFEVTSLGIKYDPNTQPPKIESKPKVEHKIDVKPETKFDAKTEKLKNQDNIQDTSFSEDSLKNIFTGEFQKKEESIAAKMGVENEPLVSKKPEYVRETAEEIEDRLRREGLEEATQVIIRKPEPVKEKPHEEKKPESKAENKPPKDKKPSIFSKFGKKSEANTEEQSVAVRVERRQEKRPLSNIMSALSILGIVTLILSGLYHFRYNVFSENTGDRISLTVQKILPKLGSIGDSGGTNEAHLPPPPPPPPPPPSIVPVQSESQQTAAQDPNLKIKVESQLESGANQKLPDSTVPQVPPNPPDSGSGSQKLSYVEVDLKSFNKTGKLMFLTNGPIGTKILVYVSARTGEILTFPSFYREYKLIKKTNKGAELDLSGLPPGRFNIEAEIGDIKKLRILSIREDEFGKRIESHLKQVSFEQQKEKKALYYGAKSLQIILKRLFDTARLAQSQNREWSSFYASFRQNVKSVLSALVTSLNDSNRNNYAYPDEIFDLIDLKDALLKSSEDLDRDIRAKKPIEQKAEQEIYKDLEKVRKKAAVLSVRKVLN